MKAIPVRRLVAALGLVALAVIGYLLLTGQLTVLEAGQRAGLTLAAAMVATRLGGWGFERMATSLEPPEPAPARRATDAAD